MQHLVKKADEAARLEQEELAKKREEDRKRKREEDMAARRQSIQANAGRGAGRLGGVGGRGTVGLSKPKYKIVGAPPSNLKRGAGNPISNKGQASINTERDPNQASAKNDDGPER